MAREGHTLTSVTACVASILATGRPVSDRAASSARESLRDAWQNLARCIPPHDLDAQVLLAPSLQRSRSYILDCVPSDPPEATDDKGRVIHTAVTVEDIVGLIFGGEASAVVFEATPHAFALVTAGGTKVYAVGDACQLVSREDASRYVADHIGSGAACNVFLTA